MKLVTRRLKLRKFKPEDADWFSAINADPRVMSQFPAPLTRPQSDALLTRIIAHWNANNFGLFAVALRDTNDFIGFVGLMHPPYNTPFTPCVEIGWRLTPSAWGKGYATEAAQACLHWGFTDLNLPEIVSFSFEGNTRSRRVMERLGMTRNPTEDFDHPMLPPDSPLLRHVLYRLPKPADA